MRDFIVAALCCAVLSGCEDFPDIAAKETVSQFTIAAWNVQALFDGTDAGTEYDEYRASQGWNAQKYAARLTSLGKAAESLSNREPDVIAFVEVENTGVLTTLAGEYLKKARYQWAFFAGNPGYSLGIGVVSRVPLTRTRVHSVVKDGEVLPRPIAEVWLEPESAPLVLFICHWKSKLGGDEATEGLRRNAARAILRRQREIRAEYGEIPMLVLGDLNESHDEFARQGGEAVCALLPDSAAAAAAAAQEDSGESAGQQDYLVLSDMKPPAAQFFENADGVFYSPWYHELESGSYYYSGEWETIDHFLLSPGFFDGEDWEFAACHRCDVEPFVNSKGEPATYNPRTGSGLSDHLPLVLTLKK